MRAAMRLGVQACRPGQAGGRLVLEAQALRFGCEVARDLLALGLIAALAAQQVAEQDPPAGAGSAGWQLLTSAQDGLSAYPDTAPREGRCPDIKTAGAQGRGPARSQSASA